MKLRILILVVLLAAIGGAAAWWLLSRPSQMILTGIVTTDDRLVSAQLQGRIEKLLVQQGDIVKRGQILALIQPALWQADAAYYAHQKAQAATQVSEAQAQLRFRERQTRDQIAEAQANLAVAQAQQKAAEADREIARLNFQRVQDVYQSGAQSVQAYDEARTTLASAEAKVQASAQQVDAAKAALTLAKAGEEQVAQQQAAVLSSKHQLAAAAAQQQKADVQLGYTEVHAPIDGIVDVRAALQGEVVNPGQPIVTLINPDDLWVRADVEETYIDRIHLGDVLKVRLPSGKTLDGVVFYRGVDADFATQRDVSRTKRDIKTFEIRLRCDNRDRALAVGMTAYVTLPVGPG